MNTDETCHFHLDGFGVLGLLGVNGFADGLNTNSFAFGFNVDFFKPEDNLSTDSGEEL